MRDVKRIKPFLEEVEKLWEKHQDLRFGQMMYNLMAEFGDPFYWEEDKFLEKFKQSLGEDTNA